MQRADTLLYGSTPVFARGPKLRRTIVQLAQPPLATTVLLLASCRLKVSSPVFCIGHAPHKNVPLEGSMKYIPPTTDLRLTSGTQCTQIVMFCAIPGRSHEPEMDTGV